MNELICLSVNESGGWVLLPCRPFRYLCQKDRPMAKKTKDEDNEIPSWIRDLYKEDLDRVVRGERPMFFGSMEDEPLRNVYPEYDLLSSGSSRLLRAPGRGIGNVLGFAKDKDEPPTLNDINKGIGRAIRGVGNKLPRPLGSLWKGAFDVLYKTPDNGVTAVATPFMYLINQDENERRKANGEYPLGYVDLVDFVWPSEKYGMPWSSRTREEVMEWEIKHGTRPAEEVELPNVDVHQESKNLAENLDRKPDGGEIDFDALWREDVERRMRGDRAVYFPYMNDEPLINEHPEFVLPVGRVSSLGSYGVPSGSMGLTARGVLSGINKGLDKASEFVENNINWPILRRIEPYLEKIYDRLSEKGNSRRNFRWFIRYLNEIDDHGVRFIAPLINGSEDEDKDVKSDGGYIPRWTDKDEADFQDWYARVSAYKGLDPDPDDNEQYYDYRSFWKENLDGMADRILTDDPEAHFTDRYKFPGHPTFSVESIYSNDRTPGGTWEERDGVYYYHPSEYTFGYIGRTLDYLAGSGSDGIYLEGEYMMIPSMGDGGGVDTGRPYGKGKYVIDPDRSNENKREDVYDEIYDYLTEERKFPGTQAVAILANIAAESGGDTTALGAAGDFGIQQWLGPRKKELKRRYGEHPTLRQQLDYLVAEHSGEVPGMGWNYQNQGRFFDKDAQGNDYNYYMYSRNDFLAAKNYKDATIMWNQGFGRPLGSTLRNDVRVRLADRFAKRYGVAEEAPATINLSSSPAGDGGVDNVVSANPSSSPVGQYSPMVDDWWNSEGRDLLYNVMATAGANAKKVEELSAQIKGDEPTAEQVMAMRMEENERNKRRVAMDILSGIKLNVPGMAIGN